ncbi:MAG: PEP-CTERM sorting domain-containing protein, partial [Bacteroidetes bacterium]|nr:PEP-CTERM sorting domain-containing protein [Bacteroidota bacterium]
ISVGSSNLLGSDKEWVDFSLGLIIPVGAAYWDVHLESNFGAGNNMDVHWDSLELTSTNPVPEPATIIFLGLGLLGLARISRRKTQH